MMDSLSEVVYCSFNAYVPVLAVDTWLWLSHGMDNGTGSRFALVVDLTQSRIT